MLEDDDSIREFVLYALNQSDMPARGFACPSAFWKAVDEQVPRLLLLDIMLPEEDGLSVLKKFRSRTDTARVPVIMLTAKSTEFDKVAGLEAGADDYVAKPFGMMELLARVKALLRRTEEESPAAYTAGGLYVCPARHSVRADGREIALTLKEFELLSLLIAKPGSVFTREEILRRVWGFTFEGESRTVDVHIRTLRAKLGVCGSLIRTVRGVGYLLSETE